MSTHIDLTELNKVADGDQDFMKETVALLLEEIPENIKNINQYVETNDIVALKKIVHKMKSSFMLIGMKEIWPLIHTMERSDSPTEIVAQTPDFIRICSEAIEELKSI